MSAFGTKRTFRSRSAMSAFGGKADIAFCDVDVAIDYLEVWQALVGEQLRPWDVPVFVPYAKQGDPVIYFGVRRP
jgi:hypothetical protein